MLIHVSRYRGLREADRQIAGWGYESGWFTIRSAGTSLRHGICAGLARVAGQDSMSVEGWPGNCTQGHTFKWQGNCQMCKG
jgi:hypothetical protein